jgi:hypothetical protein
MIDTFIRPIARLNQCAIRTTSLVSWPDAGGDAPGVIVIAIAKLPEPDGDPTTIQAAEPDP